MNTAVEYRPPDGIVLAAAMAASLAMAGCQPADAPEAAPEIAVIGGADRLGGGTEPHSAAIALAESRREFGAKPADDPVRERLVRENAMRFGSQSGFLRRVWEIQRTLEARSSDLSAVYDFNRVAKPAPERTGYLLPPVIIRSRDAFAADPDGETVSAADEYFVMARHAALSPIPPTWRDYLLMHDAEAPRLTELQKARSTAEERKQNRWIREGWIAGLEQADAEFALRFRRLKRDFEGMLEFRRLQALGMVRPPETFAADFGVTGGSGEMRLGDRAVRIVSRADFQRNPEAWRPGAP